MNLQALIPGIIGAIVGVVGWLAVGLFIQRRQFVRQARNAARAVYFEVDVNRLSVDLALQFGSFTPLGRSSFERLLPELATILRVDDLRTIAAAYMGHAGYQQMATEHDLPREVRKAALQGVLAAHDRALDVLRRGAFSNAEARSLLGAPPDATRPDGVPPDTAAIAPADRRPSPRDAAAKEGG
jgi:hypothetical protein